MRIRVTAALAAAAVLAASLAACSGTPSGTATVASNATVPLLRVGLDFNVTDLDETKTIGAGNVTNMALETLEKFGPQGQLEPDLATSFSQTSPVTYVYHLRHGAKFWDGHPVTATDVAYSLNYDRAPGSQVAFAFAGVKSIVATDQYTVTVTLTQPEASWQYVPAELNSYIFEAAFQQAHRATYGQPGTLVMGSGPWVIDSFDPTKGAVMTANPHWWGGKVPVQRVEFTFYSSETSEALAFRAGEIDLDPSITSPKSFAATSGATLLATPDCANDWFGMNTSQPGWDDVHVRRAVAYALNRTDIIAAYGGYATPIYTFTPPSLLRSVASQSQINALLASLPLYQYNLAAAKQEMAQSAYPHGFSATISAYNSGTVLDVNQVIAAELAKIGIKLQIKSMALTPWQGVESGPATKRSTVFASGGCFQPDPGTYADFLGSNNLATGNWNIANYAPPTVDTLLAQGQATTNPAQRFAVYSKLWARLQADVPYVGLFVSDRVAALSPKFTWQDYNPWYWESDYLIGIRAAA
jgi:peptide/nickel transport system substrate-binding protein